MRRASKTMTVLACLVMSLVACGGGAGKQEPNPEAILDQYRPQYDAIRATLKDAARHLPDARLAHDSCTSEAPAGLTGVETEAPFSPPGNTEAMPAQALAAPYHEPDFDPPLHLHPFHVVSGYLSNGLWLTGREDPLRGSDIFAKGSSHADVSITNIQEPDRRLRRLLQAGIKVRYVVAVRISAYREPDYHPVDPDVGTGVITTGRVDADAFVIDLKRRDIPCSFTAHGKPLSHVAWTTGTAHEAMYKDMQTSLALDIDDKLRGLTRRR